jgi:TonB family protein
MTGLRHWLAALSVAALFLASRSARAQSAPDSGAVPAGGAGAAVKPAAPRGAPPKPKIIMPKLVHFEPAPYPPEAQKQGLQAQVVLRLTIDKDGKVTAAEVMKPAGHGFDEAAQAAALKFVFTPALVNGKPTASRILYQYRFTLAPAPVKKPPLPPKTGKLGGVLRIAGTDAPLAGAIVLVTKADGSVARLVTGADGRWQLTDQLPGAYKVKVTAEGYVPVAQTEQVVAGEAVDVTYRLAPKPSGLEVLVQGERPPREVTRRTLTQREIEYMPGTGGDALRSLLSLPGVARPPALAGLLIVRGSAPEDTQTFIDGSAVPIVYHFGGLSSVVPTELLDRIDFYPGNFSERYGRVMGGIVDVGLRSPDTRCNADYGVPTDKYGCYHGMAELDLIDGRILAQGPLGPLKNWTFAVAARRSWIDVWLKPVLEDAGAGVTTAPVYYDYQVITETHPTHDSKLSFRVFGSDDRLDILVTDPAAQDPGFGGDLTFGTAFYRVQGLYDAQLSPSVNLTSMLAVGKDAVDFSLGTLAFQVDDYPIDMRSELGFQIAPGFKLNTGLDFITAPYSFSVRAPPPPRPGEPDPGPFALRPPQVVAASGTAFRPAWYAEAELQPTARLRIVPGARVDYARDTGHADFSPRVNARYDIVSPTIGMPPGKRRLRTTIKGGVGVFDQPPQFQETNSVLGTPGLYSNRAIHYSVGLEQELSQHVEVSVEGFYKDLTNLVESTATVGGYTYNNLGSGYVIGLETLIKYKPDKHFFGWIAYTLSRSVRQNGPNDPEYLFHYDQTHNLTVLGSYRMGRGWEFGARFRIVSGSLVTPVLSSPALPAVFAADAGAYTPLQGHPDSERLPLFHQLDLRVDKRWQFKDWRFSAYLDVQNVYNNEAVEGVVYNYNYAQQTYETGLPILPSIGVRGEF